MCDVDVMLYMYFYVSVIILLVLDWMQNTFWIFESLFKILMVHKLHAQLMLLFID